MMAGQVRVREVGRMRCVSSASSQELHCERSGKYIYHVIISHTVVQVTWESDFFVLAVGTYSYVKT